MNSLDRARRFIGNKATKLAIAIVPLAALTTIAPPAARAGSLVFSPSATCAVSDGSPNSGGSCVVSQANTVGGDPNGNWLQLYTPAPINAFSPQTQQPDPIVELGVSGGGASGTVSSGEMIPISYDFFINRTEEFFSAIDEINATESANWNVSFDIYGSGGSCNSGSSLCVTEFYKSGSALIGSEVTGTGFVTIGAGGGTVSSFNINLEVNSESDFSVTIPSGETLDLNPVAAPEPASVLLAGAGGAFLLFLRKRRRA